MSSPGVYSRCSANSTLNPLYGLLCKPVMNPSTTVRAMMEMFESFETTSGTRYLWTVGMLLSRCNHGTPHPTLSRKGRESTTARLRILPRNRFPLTRPLPPVGRVERLSETSALEFPRRRIGGEDQRRGGPLRFRIQVHG